MALFDIDAILADEKETCTINLDFFAIPEGEETPTLTIELSAKTRKLYQEALNRHNSLKIQYRKGKAPEGVIINEPIQFCHEMLNEAYLNSSGIFESPTKKGILALLKREPKFAKGVSSKLMDTFENSVLYTEEEDDAKN